MRPTHFLSATAHSFVPSIMSTITFFKFSGTSLDEMMLSMRVDSRLQSATMSMRFIRCIRSSRSWGGNSPRASSSISSLLSLSASFSALITRAMLSFIFFSSSFAAAFTALSRSSTAPMVVARWLCIIVIAFSSLLFSNHFISSLKC